MHKHWEEQTICIFLDPPFCSSLILYKNVTMLYNIFSEWEELYRQIYLLNSRCSLQSSLQWEINHLWNYVFTRIDQNLCFDGTTNLDTELELFQIKRVVVVVCFVDFGCCFGFSQIYNFRSLSDKVQSVCFLVNFLNLE